MKLRILAAALTLSAAGLIAIVTQEGYTERAVIPTKGDVPTVGFGSTKKSDGSPVKMGDRTDPVRALRTVQDHLSREEQQFRDSLPGVKLTQGEYDLYVDFMYQYGIGNWLGSSMRKHLLASRISTTTAGVDWQHRAACDSLLLYKRAAGYDCSTPGNTRCPGVWTRQKERHAKCMGEQVP